MHSDSQSQWWTPSSALSRRAALALMFAAALAGVAGLMAWGPVVLRPQMHQLADARVLWGVPSGLNIWTHLPLLPVGLWGLWRVSHLSRQEPLRLVWACFFIWQMLATVGGMVYHWRPDDQSFIWDQVPRSAACALFSVAFLAERIDRRAGLRGGVLLALLSVLLAGLWWVFTLQQWGAGDLRPLIWLEYSPVGLLAAGAWTLQGHLLSRRDWQRSLLSFGVAQAVDWADRPIFEASHQMVSGHALRHLALAACVGWVAWRLGQQYAEKDAAARATASLSLPEPAEQAQQTRHTTSVTSFPDKRLAS
jgi:hypothetical protein